MLRWIMISNRQVKSGVYICAWNYTTRDPHGRWDVYVYIFPWWCYGSAYGDPMQVEYARFGGLGGLGGRPKAWTEVGGRPGHLT